MEWCRVVLLAVAVTLVGGASAYAQDGGDYGDGNVRARLVTDTNLTEPGTSIRLGVYFEIKPGWHIYWHNPGGAGLATEIQWRLPEGFHAGDLQWPLPIFFEQSDGIPGYGYEDSVILASTVVVPAAAAGRVTVAAEVSWLACKGVCVLGSASLEGGLGEIADPAAFEKWSTTLPLGLDPEEAPFALRTTGGLGEQRLTLWLQWRQPPDKVEWFPAPPDSLEVTNVRVQNRAGLTRIDSDVRPMAGVTPTSDLFNSLVVATSADGERRGWELEVELDDN